VAVDIFSRTGSTVCATLAQLLIFCGNSFTATVAVNILIAFLPGCATVAQLIQEVLLDRPVGARPFHGCYVSGVQVGQNKVHQVIARIVVSYDTEHFRFPGADRRIFPAVAGDYPVASVRLLSHHQGLEDAAGGHALGKRGNTFLIKGENGVLFVVVKKIDGYIY
jgi:hypothetical protein